MKKQWIFIIAVLLMLSLSVMAEEKVKDEDYIGHMKCKMCHNKAELGKIHDVWKKMKHANAMKALETDEAKAVAKEKGLEKPPAESPECLQCHMTAYNPKTKKVPAPLEKTKKDGIFLSENSDVYKLTNGALQPMI